MSNKLSPWFDLNLLWTVAITYISRRAEILCLEQSVSSLKTQLQSINNIQTTLRLTTASTCRLFFISSNFPFCCFFPSKNDWMVPVFEREIFKTHLPLSSAPSVVPIYPPVFTRLVYWRRERRRVWLTLTQSPPTRLLSTLHNKTMRWYIYIYCELRWCNMAAEFMAFCNHIEVPYLNRGDVWKGTAHRTLWHFRLWEWKWKRPRFIECCWDICYC